MTAQPRTTLRALLATCLLGLVAVVGAGCGGASSAESSTDTAARGGDATQSAASTPCAASFGHMGPLTGPAASLGQEQLHWSQFAVERFNAEHGTQFKLVEGDTQLDPAQASTVARQFVSNADIVATVGPADSASTQAAGPLFERADFAMVGMSATSADLTSGAYPTFSRVNGSNIQQVPTITSWIEKLKAKKVFAIDDGSVDKVALTDGVTDKLKSAGIEVVRESLDPEKQADLSPLASKIDPSVDVVFIAWELASKAQDLGEKLQQHGSRAHLVGSSGLFSPDFHIEGAYITSFAPDIHAEPAAKELVTAYEKQYGKFGTFGPPAYAAAQVVMKAIYGLCQKGEEPTRAAVLDAIRKTDIPTSILGYPLRFDAKGDDPDAKFPMFHVRDGSFVEVSL